jgi:hypothetical protein
MMLYRMREKKSAERAHTTLACSFESPLGPVRVRSLCGAGLCVDHLPARGAQTHVGDVDRPMGGTAHLAHGRRSNVVHGRRSNVAHLILLISLPLNLSSPHACLLLHDLTSRNARFHYL